MFLPKRYATAIEMTAVPLLHITMDEASEVQVEAAAGTRPYYHRQCYTQNACVPREKLKDQELGFRE